MDCPDVFSFLTEFGSSVIGAAVGAYLGAHFAFAKSREQKTQDDENRSFNALVSAYYSLYSNLTVLDQLECQLTDVQSQGDGESRPMAVIEISSNLAVLDLQSLVPILITNDRSLIPELRQAELSITDALNLHHQRNQWVRDHLKALQAPNDKIGLWGTLQERTFKAEDEDLPKFITNARSRLVSVATGISDVIVRNFGKKLDPITDIKPLPIAA